jgi:hypothetical protein
MMDVDQIKDRTRGVIMDQIDRGTTMVGSRVREHVVNIRTMSGSLRGQGFTATAELVDVAGNKMDQFSSYLIDNDGERVVHDLEELARKQPIFTVGLGFLIGLLGARVLKASARDRYQTYASTPAMQGVDRG